MTHTVPPADRRLFRPILERLHAESAERFGFEGARLEPVSYEDRPFSRLCRAAVWREGAAGPDRHVFVKIFKPKDPAAGVDMRARVVHDFATTLDIYAFMCRWPDLGVVRPVACYDDLLASVTEQAEGITLLEELKAHATWFPSAARLRSLETTVETVGRWLKQFQGFRPGDTSTSAAALRDYVDTRLRRLVEHHVVTARDRQRILDHLEQLGRRVSDRDLMEVAVHADMAPPNILVHRTRVVVLDFAMTGRGTALHDISRMYMQLGLLRIKPHFRKAVTARLQAALLRGFDPALTPEHPLFRLLSMLHHVNHFGTLSLLRREALPARLLSARGRRMHWRWIADELTAGSR